MTQSIEEALRLSHCANPESGHKCVGTCILTPTGVELKCDLCGDDAEQRGPKYNDQPYVDLAKTVLEALGLEWDAFSAEAQLCVIRQLKLKACPGCGRVEPIDNEYHRCVCGEYTWSRYQHSWKKEI